MYTVLVVDKKKQMYNIYKNMINWKEYDFELIAFVDNENDAVSYYSEYQYDLVLLDLDLKEGNGLSLINKIRKINSSSNIIVCTYKDDYQSMRLSWKSGIRDYLLKGSIKNVQMRENLEEMREKFVRHNITSEHTWQQELQKYLGLIRDQQSIHTGEFYQLLKRSELSRIVTPNCMLFFRLDNVKHNFWENKITNREKLYNNLKSTIQRALDGVISYNLLFSKKHAGIILVDEMKEEQLQMVAENLIRTVQSHMGVRISIAISKTCKGYDDFYKEYITISDFLPRKFYSGDQSIIFMEHEQVFNFLDQKDVQFQEAILNNIDIHNFNKIPNIEKDMIFYMKQNSIVMSDVMDYCQSIIHSIEVLEAQKGIVNKPLFELIQVDFLKVENINYLSKYFHNMLSLLIEWIKEASHERYSKPVLSIIQFVEDNLDQKITLEMISSSIQMSPAHISRIFKKQTNKNLIQYINEQKMLKAVKLLHHKKKKIKDIAKSLGMNDQLYFNKVFKTYYHMSPREYRNSKLI